MLSRQKKSEILFIASILLLLSIAAIFHQSSSTVTPLGDDFRKALRLSSNASYQYPPEPPANSEKATEVIEATNMTNATVEIVANQAAKDPTKQAPVVMDLIRPPPVDNVPNGKYNATEYTLKLMEAARPFDNVTSCGYYPHHFYSGFRNQGMVFNGIILEAVSKNCSQILLNTLNWKDQFGTNRQRPHHILFDVVHWNSFYPGVPRLVYWDETVHPEISRDGRYKIANPLANATRPMALAHKQNHMWFKYKGHTRAVLEGRMELSPVLKSVMQGAFRPHPALQAIVDQLLASLDVPGKDSTYIGLHARIEPDMQKHPVCRDKKVIRLQEIFDMMYQKFPTPPAPKLLIITGRRILDNVAKDPKSDNEVAKENLKVLNDAVEHGLWNGTVKVFEAGETLLENTTWNQFAPSIAGGIISYFLLLDSKVFIGTEVSTYSTDIQATRFYRGIQENYKYLPEGIVQTTDNTTKGPPRFVC